MNKILAIIFVFVLSVANAAQTEYQVIMPFPPGGATDITFKQFQKVVESGGQVKFDVDYKVGAGGLIAMKYFLSSNNNNLLLWSGLSLTVANEVLKKQPEYTSKDFRPVIMTERTPMLLVLSPKTNKIKTLDDLYAPGCDQRVVVSVSAPPHEIIGRILEKTSTCKISLVQYQGDAAPIADAINGSIDLALIPWVTGKNVVDQGGVVLGTTADPKDPEWNRYPALATKVPNAVMYSSYGLLARADMSDSQVSYLIKAIKSTWSNDETRNSFSKPLPGVTTMQLYDQDYRAVLNQNIKSLTQLSRQLDFQK